MEAPFTKKSLQKIDAGFGPTQKLRPSTTKWSSSKNAAIEIFDFLENFKANGSQIHGKREHQAGLG